MNDWAKNMASLAVVLAALVWVVWMGRRRLRRGGRPETLATDKVVDQRFKLQRAMEQLQVSIMEFGRDTEARLDTKIAFLTQLLRDADERIKELRELGAAKARAAGDVPPLHREVYSLADQGVDKVDIARRTSITPGEVDLILGLRRSRNG